MIAVWNPDFGTSRFWHFQDFGCPDFGVPLYIKIKNCLYLGCFQTTYPNGLYNTAKIWFSGNLDSQKFYQTKTKCTNDVASKEQMHTKLMRLGSPNQIDVVESNLKSKFDRRITSFRISTIKIDSMIAIFDINGYKIDLFFIKSTFLDIKLI